MLISAFEVIASNLGFRGINNMFILHLSSPFEFSIVVLILNAVFDNGKRVFALVAITLFVLFAAISTLVIDPIDSLNLTVRGVQGVLVIAMCLGFFIHLFRSDESLNLLSYPFFWLFSGWLIYYSGTLFLFLMAKSDAMNITYPIIHSVLNIFLNLNFIYVLWLGSRRSTSPL